MLGLGKGVECVDAFRHLLLVGQRVAESLFEGVPGLLGGGDCFESHLSAAGVEIIYENLSVSLFLAELHIIPVRNSRAALLFPVAGHGEIEESRPEFCIDLVVDSIG